MKWDETKDGLLLYRGDAKNAHHDVDDVMITIINEILSVSL